MIEKLAVAVRAARDRKALDLNVLNLTGLSSFTDYFLICSGSSTRHSQAICDGILEQLEELGTRPAHVEGYSQAEWILVDCLDVVIHIFSERARNFYDLERLWRTAPRVTVADDPENG
jgi:ribosome-associated protein